MSSTSTRCRATGGGSETSPGVRNLTRTPDLEESHPAWSPSGEVTFTRHGETGPIELWRIGVDGSGARRLSTTAEPVFVFDWA